MLHHSGAEAGPRRKRVRSTSCPGRVCTSMIPGRARGACPPGSPCQAHLVLLQLHGVLRAALGHTAQRGHVVEHLRQRHRRLDHLQAGQRGTGGQRGAESSAVQRALNLNPRGTPIPGRKTSCGTGRCAALCRNGTQPHAASPPWRLPRADCRAGGCPGQGRAPQ